MLKKLLVGLITLVASVSMALAAVNINTATEQELQSLPGIGPAKAKAIIDYRTKNGNFKAVEDIKNVKGIGDKTLEKFKAQLAVSGATTIDAKAVSGKTQKAAATDTAGKAAPAAAPQSAPAKPAKK